MPSINAKEEIYKILKYQKKMNEQNEQSGGGSKNQDYREKIQEHRQNLMDAGYKKQEIERMIQKGGQTLDELLKKVEAKAIQIDHIATERCNQMVKEKQEIEKLTTAGTVALTAAQKKMAELEAEKEKLTAEKDALAASHVQQRDLQTAEHGAKFQQAEQKIEQILEQVLQKLTKCAPLDPKLEIKRNDI